MRIRFRFVKKQDKKHGKHKLKIENLQQTPKQKAMPRRPGAPVEKPVEKPDHFDLGVKEELDEQPEDEQPEDEEPEDEEQFGEEPDDGHFDLGDDKPDEEPPARHPRCTQAEDCVGDASSPLFQHVEADRPGDMYCSACWALSLFADVYKNLVAVPCEEPDEQPDVEHFDLGDEDSEELPNAMPDEEPPARHPRCTQAEDCVGDASSPLFQHVEADRPGDMYCSACWALSLFADVYKNLVAVPCEEPDEQPDVEHFDLGDEDSEELPNAMPDEEPNDGQPDGEHFDLGDASSQTPGGLSPTPPSKPPTLLQKYLTDDSALRSLLNETELLDLHKATILWWCEQCSRMTLPELAQTIVVAKRAGVPYESLNAFGLRMKWKALRSSDYAIDEQVAKLCEQRQRAQ